MLASFFHFASFLQPKLAPAIVKTTPVITPAGQSLRILSLNWNAETVPSEVNSYLRDTRYKAMLDWVKINDPDIILLQEGWNYNGDPSVAQSLGRALGYDVAYHLDMGAPGVVYVSEAVLAKKKFKMSDEQDILLPHSAPFLGDGKNWILITGGVTFGVGATLHLDNNEPMYVYTSHMVGNTDNDRRDQMEALNEAVRKKVESDGGIWGRAKVIIGGDLNSSPKSPLDDYMHVNGYQDAWETTHPDDGGETDCSDETHRYFNPAQLSGDLFPDQSDASSCERIDHIYTLGDSIHTAATTLAFMQPLERVWMSDHYGVFATIGVNGATPTPPNNLRDTDKFMLPTHMLNITKEMFYCDGPSIDRTCGSQLAPFYVVGPRGLTIKNVPGAGLLHVMFDRGPGNVLGSPHATLDSNTRATFYFSKDGDYTFRITDSWNNVVIGKVHAVIEQFTNNPPTRIQ